MSTNAYNITPDYFKEIANSVDEFRLMTYDYDFRNPSFSIGSMPKTKEDVEQAINKGVPKDKLFLGIAAYGRRHLNDGTVEEYGYTNYPGMPSSIISTYPPIEDILTVNGCERKWDDKQESPYIECSCCYKDNRKFWFEDKQSFDDRKKYAEEQGLAGISVWRFYTSDEKIWGVNQSPVAILSADTQSGTAPLTVIWTLGYTDPENAAGTYSLDYGDSTTAATGSINSGATTTVQHNYLSAGNYTATLTVTDDKGATATQSVNVNVSGTRLEKKVSAKWDHTCVILSDGVMKCWGYNGNGELGNGRTYSDSTTPVSVSGVNNATSITAGITHTCALLSDGTIKCWGYNYYGQLGNGTNTNSNVPVSVDSSLYTFLPKLKSYYFAMNW